MERKVVEINGVEIGKGDKDKELVLYHKSIYLDGEEVEISEDILDTYFNGMIYVSGCVTTPNKHRIQNLKYGIPFLVEEVCEDRYGRTILKGKAKSLDEVGIGEEIKEDLEELNLSENNKIEDLGRGYIGLRLYFSTTLTDIRYSYNHMLKEISKDIERNMEYELRDLKNRMDNNIIDSSMQNPNLIGIMFKNT